MSPCPECLLLFLTCTPPLSLPFNLNSPCWSSCLVHPPSSHTAMMRTVSCRQHADSSKTTLIRFVQQIPEPPWKLCIPWCLLKWDFKDSAKWGTNFLCRTVCSTATWSQTGNVENVFSICSDRRYMCEVHVWHACVVPAPNACWKNPTEQKTSTAGDAVEEVCFLKREVSYWFHVYLWFSSFQRKVLDQLFRKHPNVQKLNIPN